MQNFFLPPNNCISFGNSFLSKRVRSNTKQCEYMLNIFFPGLYRHNIILQKVLLGRFQDCMFLQQFQASGYRTFLGKSWYFYWYKLQSSVPTRLADDSHFCQIFHPSSKEAISGSESFISTGFRKLKIKMKIFLLREILCPV